MRTHRLAVVVAAAGLVLSLTACSSDSKEDTQKANAAYCESSKTLQTEVQELLSMVAGGSATVEDLQDQRRQVRSAYGETVDQAEDLSDSVREQINKANQNFEDAIGDISSKATIAEATAAYNAAAAAYRDEINQVRSQLGC
jgi:hypothetical protein